MKITTQRLRQIIKEELEASKFGKEPKRAPVEDAIAELVEDDHIEWWINNAPPSLLDDIKKSALGGPSSYGLSHRKPLMQGFAQSTWRKFDDEYDGLRDAARALAQADFNDGNGRLWFLNALADKLKFRLDSEGPEETPGIGDEDETLDLAEMIKHAIREQLLGDLKE